MTAASLAGSRFVASAACLGPWGAAAEDLARWLARGEPAAPGARPAPPVPGFIESQFNPLVHEVARRCLTAGGGEPETAVVLASGLGDTTTSDVASQNVAKGSVHNPLLFFQSVPTSILGHVARQFGITGSLTCVSGGQTLAASALEMADMLLDQDDLHQVLVIGVELQLNPRTARVHALLGGDEHAISADVAVGLLLRRTAVRRDQTVFAGSRQIAALDEAARGTTPGALPHSWRSVADLIALYLAYEHLRASDARPDLARATLDSITNTG